MHYLIRAICLSGALVVGCARAEERDRELVGDWRATFQVDTARLEIPERFIGSVTIRRRTKKDTAFVGLEPDLVGASVTKPEAITYAGPSPEEAERLGLPARWWRDTYAWIGPHDSVSIRINPYSSNGGIVLSGRQSGSRIDGSWLIPGESPLAVGKFSMERITR